MGRPRARISTGESQFFTELTMTKYNPALMDDLRDVKPFNYKPREIFSEVADADTDSDTDTNDSEGE